MRSEITFHTVYRSIDRPLTILGAERRLFFLAAMVGAGTFNLFGSLGAGVALFVSLQIAARFATARDPQILRVLLNASRYRTHYDPGKFVVNDSAKVRHG